LKSEKPRAASVAPAAPPPSRSPNDAYAASYLVKAGYVPPPVFSWTGCYVGVHAGAGWQVSNYVTNRGVSGIGALGGGQAGCNYQVRQFVIGIEGEAWASTLHDRDYVAGTNFTSDAFSRNRWDGAISVRSGLAFERAFLYGKLGAVWGEFDYSRDSSNGFPPNVFTTVERANTTALGVLLGAGFEYALTDNWTTKLEYNYIDYGANVVNFTTTECDPATCVTTASRRTMKETKQLGKLGVNYKF
jgi:outer membrane immunogenic protein